MATTSTALDAERLGAAEPGQLVVTWRRFRRHKLAVVGLGTLIVMAILCALAPWIAPYRPETQELTNQFASPSLQHWLGTDEYGRDILTRILYAGQVSMVIGLVCTGIVLSIGCLVGSVSGYFGGWIDSILMRIVDLLLSIPFFPLLLVLSQMLSNVLDNTVLIIIIVLTLFGWVGDARLIRGQILSLRNLDYVEATRALGASHSRIIFRHMLPNTLAPIIVNATLNVGAFIIAESTLSYLGYGVREPTATWGNMLSDVNTYFLQHPLLALYPGLAILMVVVSINFMGDALRDALDPRLKQ
ncbi:MAG: oligopeptide ABC transporter permease [Chloroflexia bacterium]